MDKNADLAMQYDRIYRYCYFKMHNRETAEDITQETFLRFYERYGHYGNEWTLQYLYTIAHNLCIDVYRKPVMEQITDEIEEGSYEDEAVTRIIVTKAMAGLSEEEKKYYFFGM